MMRNSRHFLILLIFLVLSLGLGFAAGPDRVPAASDKAGSSLGSNSFEIAGGIDHPPPTTAPASSELSQNSTRDQVEMDSQPVDKIDGARRGAADDTDSESSLSSGGEPAGEEPSESEAITPTPTTTAAPSPTPTITPSPTPTMPPIPTARPQPTWTPTSSYTPTPTPTPEFVNGVSSDEFIVMDDDTRQHIQEIYSLGQERGRDPRRLSRIGASIIETDQFLLRFGLGDYDLGPYGHLQPLVDYFAPSFARYGVGIRRGLTAWMVLDPTRADAELCSPGETMLSCEIRLNNPSVLIFVLGTNDIGAVESYEENMRQIIEYTMGHGVIPILASKADRYEGVDNRNNHVLHKLANEYDIPLWDFDVVAETLPGKGLAKDNVHLTFLYEFDYNDPLTLQRGYGLYNLTALMMLDEVLREMKAAVLGSNHIPQ